MAGRSVHLSKKEAYLLILLGSGPPPPTSSPAVKRLPRGSRFMAAFVFPFVGMAERPIPVDTRLNPDPPGLFAKRLVVIIVIGEL